MGSIVGYSKLLGHLPIFKGLTDTEAGDLAQLMHLEQKKEGTVLCAEGTPGDVVYILESGTAVAAKRTAQGDEQILATIEAPSVIGELALIDGAVRSATVRAKTQVAVYTIAVKDFEALRAKLHPGAHKILRNLALTLCDRLRETNERIGEFFADPEKSLAAMQKRQKELWKMRQGAPAPGAPK